MESREQQLEKLKQAIGKYILPCLMVLFVGLLVGFELRGGELIDGFEVNSTYDTGQAEDEADEDSETEENANKSASSKSSSKSASGSAASSQKASTNGSDSSQLSSDGEQDVVVGTDNSHLPYNIVGNTLSNILNGGFLTQQGEWIYYSEPDDQDKLYRMKTNGANVRRISDHPVEYINVVGEKLMARNKNYSTVISYFTTSTLEFKSSIVFNPYYLTLLNDSSFICADYTYQSAIYRNYIDSNYKTALYSDYVTKMSGVYGSNVYYIDESNGNNLYSLSLDTGKAVNRISKNIEFYGINDSGIYFVSNGRLYSQSDMNTPIINDRVGCINITDNTIYFSNLDDDGRLYSMDLHGGNCLCLTDCSIEAVCVASGWIFYKSNGEIHIL